MISQLVSHMTTAVADPRRSARWVIEARPNRGEVLAMVLLGAALSNLGVMLVAWSFGGSGLEAPTPEPSADAGAEASDEIPLSPTTMRALLLLFDVAFDIVWLYIAAGLAFQIGANAGGRGAYEDLFRACGWFSLITVPWQIVASLGVYFVAGDPTGGALVLAVAAFGYMIYMFGAYVAEAHGFPEVWPVTLASIGIGLSVFLALALALLFVRAIFLGG